MSYLKSTGNYILTKQTYQDDLKGETLILAIVVEISQFENGKTKTVILETIELTNSMNANKKVNLTKLAMIIKT